MQIRGRSIICFGHDVLVGTCASTLRVMVGGEVRPVHPLPLPIRCHMCR